MEISILITIFLIVVLLGGVLLQGGKVCPILIEQIDDFVIIKYDLMNSLSHWAVKLVVRGHNLLNIVALFLDQKATQIALIQPQIHKIEG